MADQHPGAAVWKKIVDGLEGVTPGPWNVWYSEFGKDDNTKLIAFLQQADGEHLTGIIDEEPHGVDGPPSPTLEHFARCSPDNIAKVDDWIAAKDARIAELEAELHDWKNGDLRGVQAHMEAFKERATKLEAERDRLREALGEITKTMPSKQDDIPYHSAHAMLRIARTALKSGEE